MLNVAVELSRCGILCENQCLVPLKLHAPGSGMNFFGNFGVTRCGFSQKSLTLHRFIKHSKINIWQNRSGLVAHQNKTGHSHPQKDLY